MSPLLDCGVRQRGHAYRLHSLGIPARSAAIVLASTGRAGACSRDDAQQCRRWL